MNTIWVKYTAYCLIIALFGCHTKTGQVSDKEWISQEVNTVMKNHNIPGLALGVIKNGQVYYIDGHGKSNRAGNDSINEQSIFQIASQSKTLTATIANQLIAENKLDGQESIVNYLAAILEPEAIDRLKDIKLSNLLQHSAGIPNTACSIYRERKDGEYWLKGYSKDQLIADLNQTELAFEPNTNWDYSNSGYAIVGLICELVSGMEYEELLAKYIVNPYGLKNTTVALNQQQKANLVTPYKPSDRTIETKASIMGMATPASAVYTTIDDLTTILMAQLNVYKKEEKDHPLYLSNDVYKTTKGDNIFYGYGLIMEKGEDGNMYGHGGDADGFGCEYFFYPDKDMGVVLLSSSGGDWMQKLSFDILDKLQGKAQSKKSLAFAMLKVIEKEGIESGIALFEKEKNGDIYQVVVDEINGLGYKLMNKNKMKEAIEVFKLNVREFPNNANAYDSLGEAYLKNGDINLAVENYKKAFELDPANKNADDIVKKHTQK